MTRPPTVGIVDIGIGNTKSVHNAFRHLGLSAELLHDPDEVLKSEYLVLPGVGNFGAYMHRLDETGFTEAVEEFVAAERPFLGICVGMQVLFEGSAESPGVSGLGILRGYLDHLGELVPGAILPSIGSKTLNWRDKSGCQLEKAYFVHNYYVDAVYEPELIATYSLNNRPVPAAFSLKNLTGVQFHPEKSGPGGLKFLECLVRQALFG